MKKVAHFHQHVLEVLVRMHEEDEKQELSKIPERNTGVIEYLIYKDLVEAYGEDSKSNTFGQGEIGVL